MNKILTSPEETILFGEKIGRFLQKGMFISLKGDLAAGKTHFTKGIAKGLDISDVINSPTFTILKIYRKGRFPLFHVDAYRLAENDYDLGIDEYADEGVTVVEWPEYYTQQPEKYLEISFLHIDDTKREMILIPHGEEYVRLLEEIENA